MNLNQQIFKYKFWDVKSDKWWACYQYAKEPKRSQRFSTRIKGLLIQSGAKLWRWRQCREATQQWRLEIRASRGPHTIQLSSKTMTLYSEARNAVPLTDWARETKIKEEAKNQFLKTQKINLPKQTEENRRTCHRWKKMNWRMKTNLFNFGDMGILFALGFARWCLIRLYLSLPNLPLYSLLVKNLSITLISGFRVVPFTKFRDSSFLRLHNGKSSQSRRIGNKRVNPVNPFECIKYKLQRVNFISFFPYVFLRNQAGKQYSHKKNENWRDR